MDLSRCSGTSSIGVRDSLWSNDAYIDPFWRVSYHALYYTHFYLQPNAKSFRPWNIIRQGFNT